jgi:hypothetical protein
MTWWNIFNPVKTAFCQPTGMGSQSWESGFPDDIPKKITRREMVWNIASDGIFCIGLWTVCSNSIRFGLRGFMFAKQIVIKKWKK